MYTVSTDSPVIMFIFLISSLALYWGNVFNSNVTMEFAQLQYFYHKILGGTKDIMSPLSKSLGGMSPPQTRSLLTDIFLRETSCPFIYSFS